MSRPIEPGCVCVFVAHPHLIAQNLGRMVRVIEPCDSRDLPMITVLTFGISGYWFVEGLACGIVTQFGLTSGRAAAHESYLRRLDDDPDAAEPRIEQREIEHA